MVTHHGLAQSNADPLVLGVRPRVALMQNGTRKGGAVPVFETLRKSPGFEDVWQLHWSYAARASSTTRPGVFIANVDDAATIAGVLTAPAGGTGAADLRRLRRTPTPAAAPGAAPAGAPPVQPRTRGHDAGARRSASRGRPCSGCSGSARCGPAAGGPAAVGEAAGAAAHTPGVLHQGLRAGRRHLHRHQHAERLQQDLREAGQVARCWTGGRRRRRISKRSNEPTKRTEKKTNFSSPIPPFSPLLRF